MAKYMYVSLLLLHYLQRVVRKVKARRAKRKERKGKIKERRKERRKGRKEKRYTMCTAVNGL